MTTPAPAPVCAIVVSWDDPAATRAAVDSLLAQSSPPAEVVVVDNHPAAGAARALGGTAARVLRPEDNLGFAGGVALAAAQTGEEWLFLLNPDARADSTCLERLLGAVDGGDVAVAGAQVLLADGSGVNAGDNPIHLSGLAWSGRLGLPAEHGPPRDTLAVSGAAMLVRRVAFEALDGFPPGFFLYMEDVDLCWRARATGWRVRFCPRATVRHDYRFERGDRKWEWLERNRLWCLLCNLEAPTLALLLPYLAGVEAVILLAAARGGWLRAKLRAYGGLRRALPALRARRAALRARRRVGDRTLLSEFAVALDTPMLTGPHVRAATPVTRAWRALVLAVLGLREPPRS